MATYARSTYAPQVTAEERARLRLGKRGPLPADPRCAAAARARWGTHDTDEGEPSVEFQTGEADGFAGCVPLDTHLDYLRGHAEGCDYRRLMDEVDAARRAAPVVEEHPQTTRMRGAQ